MTCPICDNKPANCDCTELERRQHDEIERLTAEVERHRMTEEERVAMERARDFMQLSTIDLARHTAGAISNYLDRTALPAAS